MLKYRDKTSGLEIDSCPECFGLWFDREELKLLFQSPHLSQQILEEDAAERLLAPEDDVGRGDGVRTCPNCDEQRLFSSKMGKTQVDYCLGCQGIWLDQSELEDLVQAYRSGEGGNLLILNQLREGLGTSVNPNPQAEVFLQTLQRYHRSLK
jgi:Zn-finger nucleic acid-binding protein